MEKAVSLNVWYLSLVDECKSILIETVFTSRWALVEGYHHLGKRILEEHDNFERVKIYGGEIVQHLAESLGMSSRTLYYAVQFAAKYPLLDGVPEGKNISWNKIITKYLPAPKENEGEGHEHVWETFERCSICRKVKP